MSNETPTAVPASLQALVKQSKETSQQSAEQIQAALEAGKAQADATAGQTAETKNEQAAQVKNTVKFAAYRSNLRSFTLQLGGGDVVHFFNFEAYVPVTEKNKELIAKVNDLVDNNPEVGVSISPHGEFVEVDPIELQKQRKQAELNVFLSERAKRMAPVVSAQTQVNPSSSDASPMTKGDNSGSMRFTNVDIAAAKGVSN